MQHTQLVTEEKLNNHADYLESQSLIPELIFRLIAASIQNPKELRIPWSGSIGQTGRDGIVDSPYSFDPYVPQGQSFWEFGTGSHPAKKATEEFKKRTISTSKEEQQKSIFIFVTPRSAKNTKWDEGKQRKWIANNKKKGCWQDIKIIDGTILVQWLYLFPEIDIWLAEKFSITGKGISSPYLHWEMLKTYGSPPFLKPEVFLSGREQAKEEILKIVKNETRELLLETRYPNECVDFVVAVLASLEKNEQTAFAGRCLIIDNPDTWKKMCTLRTPHVLIPTAKLDINNTDADLLQEIKRYNHRIIFSALSSNSHGNSVRLKEIKPYELAENLKLCGYNDARAESIANKCEGNILILKKLLQKVSVSPHWTSFDSISELAIASIIGQWNGNFDGDHNVIGEILGNEYGEWIRIIRPMTLQPNPPLIQRDERWNFISRFEGWQYLGQYLSDKYLNRFSKQAIIVLREINPKLSLPKEDRWAASMYGVQQKYSNNIREGLAETLALIGAYPRALTSCTYRNVESIVITTIREILKELDWSLLASLNDVLPLLAEASPEEFLNAIEKIVNDKENKTFELLFAQEGNAMGGQNYMTGILWALETLAWHPDYLTRITLILGRLAEIDPGGNWVERPLNVLAKLFFPGISQTSANIEKQKLSVELLLREYPSIGWKLLLILLPNSNQLITKNRKPIWREFISDSYSFGFSKKDYKEQIDILLNLTLRHAKLDLQRLHELTKQLANLPNPIFSEILEYLSSETITTLSENKRLVLWETLTALVITHRMFSTADWALPEGAVQKIDVTANKLKPTSLHLLYKRLFSTHEHELYEKKGDFDNEHKKIEKRRTDAVIEILKEGNIESVIEFAKSVSFPIEVGLVLGRITDSNYDSFFLPDKLTAKEAFLKDVVFGYVRSRFYTNTIGWNWVNTINISHWTNEEKAKFFTILPFINETWERVKKNLNNHEYLYWEQVKERPFQEIENLIVPIEKFLQYNRSRAAIECFEVMLHKKISLPIELLYKTLIDNVNSNEPIYSHHGYAIKELIKWLQTVDNVDQNKLAQIEWAYLTLLDYHSGATPRVLEQMLANNSSFFCDVIRTIYTSKNEKPKEFTEEQKNKATYAYQLLNNWKTIPGKKNDDSFDGIALKKWLEEVKLSCTQSGHLEVALIHIGKVLVYSPADPTGLWIHKDAATLLDEKNEDAKEMRSGFRTELFNKRGAFYYTKGEDEKRLENEYKQKAEAVEKEGYIRLATTLRSIADSYKRDAEREALRNPFE